MLFFVKILYNCDSFEISSSRPAYMGIRRKNRRKKVLLLVETTGYFGRSVIGGIDRYATQNNWGITFEPRGMAEPLPRWLDSWDGDGVISRLVNADAAEQVRRMGLPVVEVAGVQSIQKADIIVDERLLAKMAADHLLGCGFQHFAFYSYGMSWWSFARENAFVEEMKERGHECSRLRLISGSVDDSLPQWSLNERKRLQQWLRRLPKPVAIFTASDFHAREVLLACHQNKLSVPREVAVLGVDNDPWFCQYLSPTLSSLDANGFLTGWSAAVLLENLLKGQPRPVQPITIPPLHVSVRQSTDVVAVPDSDLAAALRFLRQTDPLCTSVADLVREVGLSPRTLERRFLQYLGKTPEQEIRRIRIERSKILLRETPLSVESVGLKTGFSSQEHFIRAFKQEMGTTPGHYRLQAKTE